MWSALGTREKRFGTQQLIFSCSRILSRQLPAAQLAGVIIAGLRSRNGIPPSNRGGLYTALWYIGPLNRVPGIDFTGGGGGVRAGPFAVVYLGITAMLLTAGLFGRARQLRGT